MINDLEDAVDAATTWIVRQANRSAAQSLVLGVSGGVDSAVVAALCARSGFPTIGVILPCHSSPDSIARAEEVIEKFGIRRQFIDLEMAFETISTQVSVVKESLNPKTDLSPKTLGALRSCLRAPALDFVAKTHSGVIVGTGNRDEDELTRYFQKRGDGSVDMSPIAKFHKSEIYQLAQYLEVPDSVVRAKPSADLWGPNSGQEDEKELDMTYGEIEWGMQFAARYSAIPTSVTGGNVTSIHIRSSILMSKQQGVELTDRQKIVLERLSAMEEASRHKSNPTLPVFQARIELGLDDGVLV